MEKTRFRLDGFSLLLHDESMSYGAYGSHCAGHIGISVLKHGRQLQPGEPEPDEEVASFYVKPSHLRAIASAMLSAATEARR
jgi:hypothetical protein